MKVVVDLNAPTDDVRDPSRTPRIVSHQHVLWRGHCQQQPHGNRVEAGVWVGDLEVRVSSHRHWLALDGGAVVVGGEVGTNDKKAVHGVWRGAVA